MGRRPPNILSHRNLSDPSLCKNFCGFEEAIDLIIFQYLQQRRYCRLRSSAYRSNDSESRNLPSMAPFHPLSCRPRSHGYGGQGVKRARRETIGSEAMIASHPTLSVPRSRPPTQAKSVFCILAAFLYSANEAKLNCAITIAVADECQIGIEFDPIGKHNGDGAARGTIL